MTSVGAIRWDAWYADTGPALYTATALADPIYQYRAPFFSTVSARNKLTYRPTSDTMTREIELASQAGLYWAFLHYDENGEDADMNAGFDLFQRNRRSGEVNWCSILGVGFLANGGNFASNRWQARVSQVVAWMGQANYQKVLTDRPLVYVFWANVASSFTNDANFKTVLDALRADAQTAGLGNPYIVVMRYGGAAAEATRIAWGADAITSYFGPFSQSLNDTYANLATLTEAYWVEMTTASNSVVPIAMCGWSRRPRISKPVRWQPEQYPYHSQDKAHDDPTNAELADHFQAALDFVANNPSDCPADTVLAYAWNEFDEGGWLCPTLGDPDGERLAAVAAVITGQ